MITLDIDKEDCGNIAEFLEIYLPQGFRDFYDSGEFDNLEYVRSMMKAYDELKRAANEVGNEQV